MRFIRLSSVRYELALISQKPHTRRATSRTIHDGRHSVAESHCGPQPTTTVYTCLAWVGSCLIVILQASVAAVEPLEPLDAAVGEIVELPTIITLSIVFAAFRSPPPRVTESMS